MQLPWEAAVPPQTPEVPHVDRRAGLECFLHTECVLYIECVFYVECVLFIECLLYTEPPQTPEAPPVDSRACLLVLFPVPTP